MCELYGQKVPKMFMHFDPESQDREHLRVVESLALAQLAQVSAALQMLAVSVIVHEAGWTGAFLPGIHDDGAADSASTVAVRFAVLAVGNAVVSLVAANSVAARYSISVWRMVRFTVKENAATLAAANAAAGMLVVGAITVFSGTDPTMQYSWIAA